jgi:N-acyl-D-amino-acid deacylase
MFSSMRIALDSGRATVRALLLVASVSCASAVMGDVSRHPTPEELARMAGLSAMLPAWVQAGGVDSTVLRLGDVELRERLLAEAGEAGTRRPAGVLVNSVRADSLRKDEGIRLDSIGRLGQQDPIDAALDILVAGRGATSAIYFTMSEDDVRLAVRQPWTSIGQDAGAVTRVGLAHRGLLAPGMYGDVALFDPATIADRATFERPQQLATGVRYVLVNGVAVEAEGVATGALPGRALRGPGAVPR